MATSKFNREPEMFTTEPSDDEVGSGMKRGGKAKKHAKGGMIESAAHERKEEREIKSVKSELKRHEHEKASKAHHGLKAGGTAPKAGKAVPGGLEGGLEATRAVKRKVSEGIEGPGYKKGGKIASAEAFETKTTLKPKINVNDKLVTSEGRRVKGKTEGIEGKGYKSGGHLKKFAKGGMAIANKYENKINDGQKMPTKKAGTGSELARFKDGGHVAMSCKNSGGFALKKKMATY
jgi:hypothetical protein